jgi:hypothetical protein
MHFGGEINLANRPIFVKSAKFPKSDPWHGVPMATFNQIVYALRRAADPPPNLRFSGSRGQNSIFWKVSKWWSQKMSENGVLGTCATGCGIYTVHFDLIGVCDLDRAQDREYESLKT